MDRFNNPDKGAITHSIVHRALWEYLIVLNDASASVSDEAEREKMRREIFERSVFPLFCIFALSSLIVWLFSFYLDVAAKMSSLRWYIQKMGAAPCASS